MTSHSSWRAESALVFSSGYMANLAVVTALSGRDSLILSDLESHASLVDACRLSRARIEIFDRTNLEHIERTLAVGPEGRAIVVTDSVFSAGGDLAPLCALHDLCTVFGGARRRRSSRFRRARTSWVLSMRWD